MPITLQEFHHPRSLITGTDQQPSGSAPSATSPAADAAAPRLAPAAPLPQRAALSIFLSESDLVLPVPSATAPRAPFVHAR